MLGLKATASGREVPAYSRSSRSEGSTPLKFARGVLCVVQRQELEFKERFLDKYRGTTHISIFCVVTALGAMGEGLPRVNISLQRWAVDVLATAVPCAMRAALLWLDISVQA